MAYTFGDRTLARTIAQAGFYRINDVEEFLRLCIMTDFSVVASRRDLHSQFEQLWSRSLKGRELFTQTLRFPDEFDDVYLCSYDKHVQDTFISLGNVLSWRSTNIAKDTRAGTQGLHRDDVVTSQESQDNQKRFEELTKNFSSIVRTPAYIWSRETFEQRSRAVYT
jgi:hypothetical protein